MIQPAPLTRAERRRIETRGKLVAAAQDVIARKGVDGATVADITGAADVGLGTFYHHFESKDDVLGAVIETLAEDVGRALDAATFRYDDPAEVMATATRLIVRHVREQPLWGAFVLRAVLAAPEQAGALVERQARDLAAGIAAGRFRVVDEATTRAALPAMVLGAIRAQVAGALPDDADSLVAQLVLRVLGIPDEEAMELARRPLSGVPWPDAGAVP